MPEGNTEKTATTLKAFFLLTFTLSWFFWLIAILVSQKLITVFLPDLAWVVIGAHGPLVASFWLVYKAGGLSSIKELLFSGFVLRMRLTWWIAIFALPILLAGAAFWFNISTSNYQPDTTLLNQPLLIIPNLFFMFFLGGSFQEEFGWRGFALPRMLAIQNPFKASLLLGIIWGFWHLPLFFISGLSQSYMHFGFFLLLTVAFSYIFTWIFVKTDCNLFSALLLHTTINTSLNIFPPIEQISGGNQRAFIYLSLLYLAAALILIAKNRNFWFEKLTNITQGEKANAAQKV